MTNQLRKREEKKRVRWLNKARRLRGTDLCACGSGDRMKCDGLCRQNHLSAEGTVTCGEVYRFELPKGMTNRKNKPHKKQPKNKEAGMDKERARVTRKQKRQLDSLDKETV